MGEELYDLPDGWVWVKLEEITNNFDGSRIPLKQRERDEIEGKHPYYGASGIIDHINQYIFEGNFLLIAEDGANLFTRSKPIAFQAKGKFWVNNHAHILQTFSDSPLEYLEHYTNSIDLRFYLTGTAQPKLTQKSLNKIPVPLPPLNEQHRIVTKIEELFAKLDAGVELLNKLKIKLKRYRQAVLKAAVEGDLTKEWREAHQGELEPASELLQRILKQRREKWETDELAKMEAKGKTPKDDKWKQKYKEPVAPDTSDLPELPDGWCWAKLNEVASFKNGINFKSSQKGQLGILTVDVLNMYSNRLAVDTKELYRVDINIKEDYLLEYGDILFVRSSVKREGVGWTSLFIPISEKVTFCGFIIRARLQNLDISPKFITYYLRTDLARAKIVASSSQVTITNISQNALGNILLPIPTVNEQHYIVSKIDQAFTQIDQLEKTIETNLKRSEKLRQSILKQAFTGQLVPQDPNEEPASKLLERIKAEKAQREAQAKPKKKRRNPPKKTPKKTSQPKQLELDLDN